MNDTWHVMLTVTTPAEHEIGPGEVKEELFTSLYALIDARPGWTAGDVQIAP